MIRRDEIDDIFAETEDIVPSAGFVAAVMDAVMQEAAAPPPIPFPWKHGLAGLAVSLSLALTLLVSDPSIPAPISSGLESIVHGATVMGAGWITLALLVSAVSVKLSMRLAGARS